MPSKYKNVLSYFELRIYALGQKGVLDLSFLKILQILSAAVQTPPTHLNYYFLLFYQVKSS